MDRRTSIDKLFKYEGIYYNKKGSKVKIKIYEFQGHVALFSLKENSAALTVTFFSKKYFKVRLKPRTISVRNSVFMLRSKTTGS